MITHDFAKFRMVGFRCEYGENLNAALEQFVQQSGVGFAYMPALQAQFDAVTLGFYDPTRGDYDYKDLPQQTSSVFGADSYSRLEPTSVNGNVAWSNGKPFAHIHGAFASGFVHSGGIIVGGGHICMARVGRTAEGVLFVTDDVEVVRIMDEDPKCLVRTWNFRERSAV